MTNPYEDILHLLHHVSPTRPRMSMEDRAAQFSPFAALVGYDAAIDETARQTEAQIVLTEDRKAELDRVMQQLLRQLDQRPAVQLRYFVPDERKAGGAYVTAVKQIRTFEPIARLLFFTDGTQIPLDRIVELEPANIDAGI